MSSLLWNWHRPKLPGRISTELLPGFCVVVGTLSWCRGHWLDAVSDALIRKANEKKGFNR